MTGLSKNKSVSFLFLYTSLSFVFIAVIILGITYSLLEVYDFETETQQTRNQFIQEQKDRVKAETEKVVSFINLTRQSLKEKMNESIREQVEQAWLVMDNIYKENHVKISDTGIRKMIKDALRPVRFFNGRGYYFIVSMNGTEELYPVAPQYEGENLLDLQDMKGNFVIRDEIEIVKKAGEGFVTDYWTKPGEDGEMIYPKTSYVKYFEPLDWYVGCGDYLDNFKIDLQEQVKLTIKNIKFGKDGYVFVDDYYGNAVVIDSPKFKEGDYVGDLIDANGINILEEQRKVAVGNNGGFVEYTWPRFGQTEPVPKISYVYGLDDWEWVIGAGAYLDEIEQQIAERRKELYQVLWMRLMWSFVTIAIIIFILSIVAKRVSKKIKCNFETFTQKLNLAVNSGELMDEQVYSLKDIRDSINSINNILQRKIKAEKALEASESRFRTIVENIPVMIAVISKDLAFKIGNAELGRFFRLKTGYKLELDYFKRLLTNSPVNKNVEIIYNYFDSEFRELELKTLKDIRTQNWAAFKSDEDEIILVGYDITQLKNTQQQLKEINETKDKFFSIISHDLRSPFNAIIGYTDLLIEDFDDLDDKEKLKFLKVVNNTALATHRLLNNLLTWARAQRGRIEVIPSNLDLGMLVNELLEVLEPQAKNKDITLSSYIGENIKVYVDQAMLTTIIQNLVSNSIKFTHAGGFVKISAKHNDELTTVVLEDSGMGMDEKIVGKLFDVAANDSRKGTANESGTGLGLVICKEFVEKMGGRIWVESIVGKGSTFYFTLKNQQD